MEIEEINLNDPFLVCYNGEPKYFLNKHLAAKQGIIDGDTIDLKRLEELVELHVQKLTLFDAMENTDDVVLLKTYADSVKCIEFAMQQAWGFDLDENHHEWYLVPKCTCPKMDNRERKGTPYGIIAGNCPIHGGF